LFHKKCVVPYGFGEKKQAIICIKMVSAITGTDF